MPDKEPTFAEIFPTWKHKTGFVIAVGALTMVSTLTINLMTTGDPLNRKIEPAQIEEPTK